MNEEGRRVETAFSRRKQDEGAPFRVQTAAPSRIAKQPRKLNKPHPLKALPLLFRTHTWLPGVLNV